MTGVGQKAMLAIVMLGDETLPCDEALKVAIGKRIPDVEVLTGPSQAGTPGPFLFFQMGAMCTIMRISAPAPISNDQSMLKRSWYWPDAWEKLKNHKAHIVVSASAGNGTPGAAILLGHLVAAVVETAPQTIGVHSGNSDALWPAASIASMFPVSNDTVAVPFFVSAMLVRSTRKDSDQVPDKYSAVTHGLAAFDLMEIEALEFDTKPASLHARMLGIASYLIGTGSALKDGDTIGSDENVEMRVRHVSSRLLGGQTVYRLERVLGPSKVGGSKSATSLVSKLRGIFRKKG